VSVGLPVYNGEKYLCQAIDSILRQDFEDFELIIADNASTDATESICARYAKQDARVHYYRHAVNIGAAPNHNYLFGLARGKYFKWSAHDDECEPQFLRRCVEILEERSEVVLAYPQAQLIDQHGNVTGVYVPSIAAHDVRARVRLAAVLRHISLGTPLYGVFRGETLRKTPLHGSFISADLVLVAQMAVLGEIREVPLQLLRKRIHPGRPQERIGTREELLSWYNPQNPTGRQLLPDGYEMTLQYIRGVWKLPVTSRQKVLCSAAIVLQRHRGVRARRGLRRLFGLAGMN